MSYRPITDAEAKRGFGSPFADYLGVIGLAQGVRVLTFLHHTKAPLKSQWYIQSPKLVPVFLLYSLGGMAGGMMTGYIIFSDAGLRRLYLSHVRDSQLNLEGQIVPLRQ